MFLTHPGGAASGISVVNEEKEDEEDEEESDQKIVQGSSRDLVRLDAGDPFFQDSTVDEDSGDDRVMYEEPSDEGDEDGYLS